MARPDTTGRLPRVEPSNADTWSPARGENHLSQKPKTVIAFVLLAIIMFFPVLGSGGGANGLCGVSICQSGTSSNTFTTGSAISNLVTVSFPRAYLNTPTLICCPFTTTFVGLQIYSQF